MRINLANAITCIRIALIPVFGIFAVKYGASITNGQPIEWMRYAALASFIIAASSDGLDGYIARKYNMTSKLGAVLDALADKVLMLTGLITLSYVSWGASDWLIPKWYIIMVVGRDVSIGIGCAMILSLGQTLRVKPHWTGKATTVVQLFTLGWVMLKVVPWSPLYPTIVAAVLTLWSSWAYSLDCIQQLNKIRTD
ncbi:CDP-alcohol phosphatidyltransferase family protein [Rubritalea marina]|uniref:CDP-alcohol phosphatidyltransferase family protein n=1 Tax=Rubritalea marina TaxID=361055 RepID=UPI00037019CC|nr:CDP-alcohol phosphatidyltransferase family protein [Rubritalea marina]